MRVDPFFPAISFDNDRTVQRIEFHNRSGNHVGRGNGVFQISVVIIQEVLPFPFLSDHQMISFPSLMR